MDTTEVINPVDLPEARSESLGEKRPLENGEGVELGFPPAKKAKGDVDLAAAVKKVAEIVLVLATMGKMRGGRRPTAAEADLMADAREKLAEVCKEFAPKDIFPRDAFGTVIEDLGLSRLREQRLGIRPPKMSIAEKLQLSKQKMEKSEFALRTATYSSQRLQPNISGAAESRGTSNAVRMFAPDKPSHPPISSGSFQHPSSIVHSASANSKSLPYQLPTSEVRPLISNVLHGNQQGRDSSSLALPRGDRPNFRLDGRSNGSPYTSQAQANSSGDHTTVKTPTWSMQLQPALSTKVGQGKVPAQSLIKTEGGADIGTSHTATQATMSKQFITQTTSANPPSLHHNSQGMNIVQVSTASDTHNEICKIVQKILQPRLPEHPTWTPPSRDYMKRALTCQTCNVAVNEVDTTLICDACEKGYHLRCLQLNPKAIPRGEWHCGKCLALSNGKPLPPKYGRVMRNISTPKEASNVAAVQASLEKKVQTLDESVNQQKITANGNLNLPSTPPSTTVGNDNINSTSAMVKDSREMKENEVTANGAKVDHKSHSEICPQTSEAAVVSPSSLPVDRLCEEKLVTESKSQPPANSEAVMSSSHYLQALSNHHQDDNQTRASVGAEILSKQSEENDLIAEGLHNIPIRETLQCNSDGEIKKEEVGRSPPNGLHDVKWIGNLLNVVDEKTFYQSCCINGVVYKVQDHALFRSTGDKYMPFKLKSMWEDRKTRSKWVAVNHCYFPADLPEGVGRPCTPESNEVYESNHESTLMAGLIHGPCKVLPPSRLSEERRGSDGLRPLFICKWFYDEIKGVFRDVTC